MGNTFGHSFRITTFGESHGGAVGVIVDGCPPRLALAEADVQRDLDRRRPGQSPLTTQRDESDRVTILSGLYEGLTLGTPLAMTVANRDVRSGDYAAMRDLYRPSHADFTYQARYGIRDWRGGGRASARETVGRVAAGAVARKLLAEACGVEVIAWVRRVQELEATIDAAAVTAEAVGASPVRCPDPAAAAEMAERIEAARRAGDSVGGVIEAVARRVPAGWGAPVFDKLEAELAHGLMSIPAARGFEIGSGFGGTLLRGSEHNDPFVNREGRIRTSSNRSGGIQGGISNGEDILVRVAFKPTATIALEQDTVDTEGRPARLRGHGRHDPCVLPRAVPVVEAMVLLVLADHYLRYRGQCSGLAER